jgi:hypothetical protein
LEEAWRLRARADELRALAARVEASQAMTLHLDADDVTWRGPGPELCRRLLGGNQHQLRLAVEELRRRGGILDRQATEIEVDALLRSVTG